MGDNNSPKPDDMETNQFIASGIPPPPEELLNSDISDELLETRPKDLTSESVVQYIQSVSDRNELLYILEQSRRALCCVDNSQYEENLILDDENNQFTDQPDNRSDISSHTAISKKRKNISKQQTD